MLVHARPRAHDTQCLGNTYVNTLHVLCAAILKLGKITSSATVYRAPGGALPTSFWCKSPEGVQGGLELAFMSTTTAKNEAMAYALATGLLTECTRTRHCK